MDARWARPWFAVTANSDTAFGGSPVNQALNIFAYFTVLSNVTVGVTTLMLAVDPNRASTVFATFRLIGLVAITVTFIVFHVVLSRLLDLETWAEVANQLLHTVVPILAIVGWGMFGPRGLTSARVARLTVLFPLGYMVFTMIRGPLASDFYPYPFADVQALGYLRVSINALWIALLFIGTAAAATALDPRLPGDRVGTQVRTAESPG
jgi:hypothetical protein